jgi:hypothetical protein
MSSSVTIAALAGDGEVLIGLRAAMTSSRAGAVNLGEPDLHVLSISRTPERRRGEQQQPAPNPKKHHVFLNAR